MLLNTIKLNSNCLLKLLQNNSTKSTSNNNLVILNYLLHRCLTSSTNTTNSAQLINSKTSNKASIDYQSSEKLPLIDNRSQTDFGFLFDIDGVLVRGKTPLPHTKQCMKLLTDNEGNFKVPTIFLTNAGNELRSSKSAKLSSLLGVKIRPDQVVMSHSPLKLFKSFHNKRCLISGQGPLVEIARNLGFNNLITVEDLQQYYPHLDVVDHKRRSFAPCVLSRYFAPIEAVILFGESVRWETNLQLLIDVLMCDGKLDQAPKKFPSQNLPILACNTDMVWMAEASMPRFGHGTFLHCLEQIYRKLSGRELKYNAIVGKPSEITYYYAERMLKKHAESIGINTSIRRMYAVGDNLDTDIYGANIYNQILENNKRYREKISKKVKNSKVEPGLASVDKVTSLSEKKQTEERMFSNSIEQTFSFLEKESSFVSESESITSILVRTGVFQGDLNDLNDHNVDLALAHKDMIVDPSLIKPRFICENVYEAVKSVFKLEDFKN